MEYLFHTLYSSTTVHITISVFVFLHVAGHVGGGPGVQYNPYDEEVIISATDDGSGLAEDVGYIAMKSGKCTNQPVAKVTTTPNCQEPAYVEIPVKLELGSNWTT